MGSYIYIHIIFFRGQVESHVFSWSSVTFLSSWVKPVNFVCLFVFSYVIKKKFRHMNGYYWLCRFS